MKTIFLILCITVQCVCFGQEYQTIKIAGPELYKLNSTTRADFTGGKRRLYVPLNIPENTLYCYITISTASGNESQRIAEGVNLFAQVMAKVPSVTAQGLSTLASLSEHILNVYQGSIVDASFLPSINDAQLFSAGRGQYRMMPQYSRSNYNGGTITIPVHMYNLQGKTIYLGLTNNSGINATWVNVEAVAVVNIPLKPTGEKIKTSNYTNLGWQSYKNGNVDKCIEYSQIALTYDSTNAVAMLNLGLCYLIKNEENEAVTFYMNALSILRAIDNENFTHYLKEALRDIENARKKYPSMSSGQDIFSLFKEEYKNDN
jgi:tetratricopeptide (TPR) repeat protein